jgi:hypothetical protein
MALGLALALALAPNPAGALAHHTPRPDDEDNWPYLIAAKWATADYHNVAAAEADGFTRSSSCVPGKGIHFLRSVAEGPQDLDLTRPNALVYAPRPDGGLKLLGIEFVSKTPATLFGRAFELSRAVHYYTLHVWIWERSPDDLFAADNPRITCEV